MIQIRFFLLLLFFGQTNTSTRLTEPLNSNNSVLILNLKYNSYGMTGFGGELKIKNTVTNELFEGHSKKGFNPFIIIENVPSGSYVVEEIKIISGSNALTIKDGTLFNHLELKESKVYYLGSYLAKKIPPLMGLNFQIIKTENDDAEKIYKQLKKKSDNWLKLNIDFEKSLFKTDSTIIKIKNYR